MQTRLKIFLICGHFLILAAILFWVLQGVNQVQEKGLVALLIFITLNLIRLFQQENRNNSNDQL
jgi:large-conductance mechanosensitive channel